jgi:hypothetical protein
MKNILKQVYGVELSAQKVELGVMQELEKYTNVLEGQIKEIINVIPQLKAIATDAYNSPAKAIQLLEKSVKEFEKDATSLGLKPSEFSSYNKAISLINSSNSKLDKFYSQILKPLNK